MELTVKVPDAAAEAIRQLRRESAKYRRQRNEARAEVARLRAEIAALRGQQ